MDKTIIESQIIQWASKNIGSSFSFREHQLEAITSIIDGVINGDHPTHIIEAPTGSGKSLLCIISAGVLAEYYDKRSYILCSDLYLFSQYETFIKDHALDFGCLKGQTGNYFCERNGEDMRNADCRIARIPWPKMYNTKEAENRGYSCARYCTYIKARKKAQAADVTLMTYQLYFFMMNVVRTSMGHPPFPARDVIFCDECHNIPSLVQNQYSPCIRKNDIEHLTELYKYNMRLNEGLFSDEDSDVPKLIQWSSENELRNEFNNIWDNMCDEDSKSDYDDVFIYKLIVDQFGKTVDALEDALATKKKLTEKLDKADIKMYKHASWYRNYCCFFNDFCTAIYDCGAEYLVKTINVSAENNEKSISFSCAKEDYMCYRYLLSTAPFQVLTSATVGLKEAYEENCGLKYMEVKESAMEHIPSTFDFTNSPILYSTAYKMSYDSKEYAFPKIREMIYQIIRAFNGKRGMIQSGSYSNAKEIFENAPYDVKKRLLLYTGSKEKDWNIEIHKAKSDSILIGPTLVEGVDLPGDLLRFIIIAKVPYPNLTDKLVKAKMKLFPLWYKSEAANAIIQGIGRGNRSKDDWCVTYILDGCFANLYQTNRQQFPEEVRNRIRQV